MRTAYRVLSVVTLLFFSPILQSGNGLMAGALKKKPRTISLVKKSEEFEARVGKLYCDANLDEAGLSREAFEYAYIGYLRLLEQHRIQKSNVLTICDFSQSSNKKRLYILDLANSKILLTSYVAHGRGSGTEYATRFSNRSRSHQSSLGFYITSSTYSGEHGLSLRLQGLEPGFNNLAMKRNIVLHGAPYISSYYLSTNKFMGRSYGCPAVPETECAEIIDMIKNGTCFFIYHPTKKYLQSSKILNG